MGQGCEEDVCTTQKQGRELMSTSVRLELWVDFRNGACRRRIFDTITGIKVGYALVPSSSEALIKVKEPMRQYMNRREYGREQIS